MNNLKSAVLGLLLCAAGPMMAQVTPFSWANASRAAYAGQGQTIARDAAGNVYTVGFFQGMVDFDPGPGVQNLTSTGMSDMYILKLSSAGNFLWVKQVAGTQQEYPHAIAVGTSGNVFITGMFQGMADFDPGSAVTNLISSGMFDMFLMRLDQNGNLLNAKAVGGPGNDMAYGLTVDANNVYYTGSFSSSVDFDPGAGTVILNSSGSTDVFVSKLTPAFVHVWSLGVGSGGQETGTCIKVDGSGNVYSGGTFNAAVDFDPSAGVANIVSAGVSDGFILSLDASGNYLWASSCGGGGQDYLNALALDGGGSVIGVGSFANTADFDPGTGTSMATSAGFQDGYIWKLSGSGSLTWVVTLGDVGYDAVRGLAIDAMSRIYCSGEFVGTVDFDPSGSTQNMTSNGQSDAFMCRLTSAGGLDFVRQIGGTGYDGSYALVTNGNKICTNGFFSGTVDFNQESGVYNIVAPAPNASYQHCFEELTKLDQSVCGVTLPGLSGNLPCVAIAGATDYRYEITDPQSNVTLVNSGSSSASIPMSAYNFAYSSTYNIRVSAMVGGVWTPYGPSCAVTIPPPAVTSFQWARQTGYSQPGLINSLITDANGDLYAVGAFLGTVDFDPGPGTYNLTSTGSADMYVLKLDAGGNFISVLQIEGTSYTMGQKIAIDSGGNIIIAGQFDGTVDFDPGSGTDYIATNGNYDIFVLKLDAAGNYLWSRTVGSALGFDGCQDLAIDGNDDIYYAGAFSDVMDADPTGSTLNFTSAGQNDGFVTKLDASGNHIWSTQIGDTGNDGFLGIEIDKNGDLVLAGAFEGTVDFDPGAGTTNLVSNGAGDMVILKMDVSGNFIWARSAGDVGTDQCISLAIAGNNDIVTGGNFEGSVDFDPGMSTYVLTSNGISDIVVWKLSSSGNLIYARSAGGISGEGLYSISLDASDNVYGTGGFMATSDFDPGSGTYNLTSTGTVDAMIWKLNANGTFGWVKQMGSVAAQQVVGLVIYVTGNDIYSAGIFQNTVDFNQESGVYNLTAATSFEGYIHKMGDFYSTQLWTANCGITLNSLKDDIYAVGYPGATDYRFEFTNGNNVTVYTVGSAINSMALMNLPGVGYGVTYGVRVSAYVNNAWLPYGAPCNVTTPAPPVTQMNLQYCNITIANFSQVLYCDPVPGATNYEYKFDDNNNAPIYYQRSGNQNDLQMGWVNGALLSTLYDVWVRASVGGTWTAWGQKCTIMTSASYRLASVDERSDVNGITLFPNPSSGDVTIDLGKQCRSIKVTVLNVAGQQVAEFEAGVGRDVQVQLPAGKGMYFLQVQATGLDHVANLRVLRQ